MRRLLPIVAVGLLAVATPAHATGGLVCKTAGSSQIEISLGFGHVPSAPLFLARLVDDGKNVPVTAPQWWLDGKEMRLALTSPDALQQELVLRAEWNEVAQTYDGNVWRNGRKIWVRCREG